jgi:hypothetical protein
LVILGDIDEFNILEVNNKNVALAQVALDGRRGSVLIVTARNADDPGSNPAYNP